MEIDRHGPSIVRDGEPPVKSSRLPHPAESENEHPASVAVGHPTPGIRGRKHETVAGIKGPGAVHERIPAYARKVRLPHHSIAGDVAVSAIVIHVAHAVRVWRRIILRVLIVVTAGFFVPGIERGLFNTAS